MYMDIYYHIWDVIHTKTAAFTCIPFTSTPLFPIDPPHIHPISTLIILQLYV